MGGPEPAEGSIGRARRPAGPWSEGGFGAVLGRAWAWATRGPAYEADAGDRRTVSVLGLGLPLRASLATVAVALLLLLDYHGRINGLVDALMGPFGPDPASARRLQAVGRLVLEGLIPLALVLVALRDDPRRYGIALGDARAGVVLGLAGALVMTPIVLALVRLPAFAAYYAPQAASVSDVALTSALEVIPAEFFFRGFLLFALLRVVGPIAVVIATLPFAFIHLGKPELETVSTLAGGVLYGWLDWRTRSVLWSGLAHTWILTLAVVAAGAVGAPPG